MPYTLVPIIDVGRSPYLSGNRQRRMPLGLDQGGHSVHLGPDRALLWTPADLADARATKLADSPDEPAALATRTALTDLRLDGRTLATRVGDAMADLLVTPPRGLWNALVATKEGALEVRLGPGVDNVIFLRRVAPRGPASKDITDDFTRTAANLAGSTTSDTQTTWAEDQGTGWTTDGDEADLSGAVNFCVGRLALAMDTADHYAQADLSRIARVSGSLFVGVTVRVNATPTSGYAIEVGTNDTSSSRRVYNFVTDATIASDTTAPATGLLYLELNGSTYTAKVGGVTIFTGTDTAHNGTVKGVGLAGYSDIAGNSAGFTSFRGADLVGAPPLFAGAEEGIAFQRISTSRLIAPGRG